MDTTASNKTLKITSASGGYREIWLIAYPLIITNASHTIMQFVDRKFLSINSTTDVAAALPGGILCFTMMTFFFSTVGFSAALVSQYHGRGDYAACSRVPWSAALQALIWGLFCTYILTHLGNFLIDLSGHKSSLAIREQAYFSMLMAGSGFIFLEVAFSSFFSGLGKTWYVAMIHFFGCAVNILLDYMLIFGKWGAPQLGIVGAGLATTLSCVLASGFAFILFISRNQEVFPTWRKRRISWPDFGKLLKFGAPTGIQVLFSVGGFTFATFLIGTLGEIPLAVTTIALSINMFAFLPLLGMSEAATIIVGRYMGSRHPEISEKAAWKCWRFSFGYMLIIAIPLLVFPETMFSFFEPVKTSLVDFKAILSYSRPILICAAVYNIFNAMRFNFIGALRGAGDTRAPMWIVIVCSWGILVPGTWTIVKILKLGIVPMWVFLTCYLVILSAWILYRFRSGVWKEIKMLDDKPPIPPPTDSLDLEPESEVPHA